MVINFSGSKIEYVPKNPVDFTNCYNRKVVPKMIAFHHIDESSYTKKQRAYYFMRKCFPYICCAITWLFYEEINRIKDNAKEFIKEKFPVNWPTNISEIDKEDKRLGQDWQNVPSYIINQKLDLILTNQKK